MRKVYKVGNREPVLINDKDAKKLGIKDGDTVEVYNDRGRVLAGAVVSKNIMSGVVSISEGAWYDPENLTDENPRCNAGHVNLLTSSRPSSTMAQATSINTCLVAIKKADTTKAYVGIKTPIVKGA